MQRCLELAKNGQGSTHPNPMVGSVILENGEIIGEGWHKKPGTSHAEVVAIESVKDKSRLKSATIYVNLEPCAHFGKTPPCALRIIQEGIPHVVIGTKDPHEVVGGKGIQLLKEAGIKVEEGFLTKACEHLNRAFFTFHRKQRPYITLKWAQSADGFIAPLNETRRPDQPHWITGAKTKQRVHKIRSEVDGILVGGNTIVMDNPSLTNRFWSGVDPIRIVWTKHPLDGQYEVMKDGKTTWIVGPNASEYGYETPIEAWNAKSVIEIIAGLYKRGVVHLLVEGGTKTLMAFIQDDLWDEAFMLTGSVQFQNGIPAPTLTNAIAKDRFKVENDDWQRFEHV